MAKAKVIGIGSIEIPSDLYPRAKKPTEKDVQHLIGMDFPPIVTAQIKTEGEDGLTAVVTVLVDGAHRLEAAKQQGWTEIHHEDLGLLEREEVLEQAIRRNATHGKQLSMSDKQKLARLFVERGIKVGKIQELLAVGERTVSRWVSDAAQSKKVRDYKAAKKLIDKGCSVAGAAKETGVSRSTLNGWLKNPPEEPKPKQAALDVEPAELDTKPAAKALGQERIDAVAEMVVEFAKDSATELANDVEGGEYSPHWVELVEAAIEKIRKQYPRGWKVS